MCECRVSHLLPFASLPPLTAPSMPPWTHSYLHVFISIFSPVSLPCFNTAAGWHLLSLSVAAGRTPPFSFLCCFLCSAKKAFHLCYQMFFRFWFCAKERIDEESGGVTQVNVRIVNLVLNFVDNLWNAVLGVAETTHSCARGVFSCICDFNFTNSSVIWTCSWCPG